MEGPCDNLIVEELTEEDFETCEVVCQPANVTECAKFVNGSDDEGNEIWEDDPESCVELEKTECKVQERQSEEEDEGSDDEEATDELKDVLTDVVTNDGEPSVIASKIDIAKEDSYTTLSPTTSTTEKVEHRQIEIGEEGQDTVETTTEELSEEEANTTTQTAMTSVVPTIKTEDENEVSNHEESVGIITTAEPTEETTISTATTTSDKTASTPEEVKNDASAIIFD